MGILYLSNGYGNFVDASIEIDAITPSMTLTEETSVAITACIVISENESPIANVLAMILPPVPPENLMYTNNADNPVISLSQIENSQCYSTIYENMTIAGTYEIWISVFDEMGNASQVLTTTIMKRIGPDVYEDDDNMHQASVINVNADYTQRHTIHDQGDEDWVKFYGIKEKVYEIHLSNVESLFKPIIDLIAPGNEIFYTDTIEDISTYEKTEGYFTTQSLPAEGAYYLRIRNRNPNIYGKNTGYDLEISKPYASADFMYYGKVTDRFNSPITDAVLKIQANNTLGQTNGTFTNREGFYGLECYADDLTVVVSSPCYLVEHFTTSGNQFGDYLHHIQLEHAGVGSLISMLQLLSGMPISDDRYMIEDHTYNTIIGIEDALFFINSCF
jgi:hypothetical protein